jgi:drug/metabolite transporter (DMT)-like permease
MNLVQALLLLLLSAIWGGSFMFMRYLSPIFGPLLTADGRMLLAGIFLVLYLVATGYRIDWKKDWRRLVVIGLANSGLPFILFSFAALYVPASIESVLNALSPMFGAVFSAIWLGERLDARTLAGLLLGAVGVAAIVGLGSLPPSPLLVPAILACVLATACYGLAGVYIKKRGSGLAPKAMAAGSQLSAGLIVLPLAAAFPPAAQPSSTALLALLAFALLCSALAYLIYYKLISEIGPTKALTVTFLIPVFGSLWGCLILGESIGPATLGGALLVLAGTALVSLPRAARPTR